MKDLPKLPISQIPRPQTSIMLYQTPNPETPIMIAMVNTAMPTSVFWSIEVTTDQVRDIIEALKSAISHVEG